MKKKSSKKIVYIVLLVFLIFGVYYIYNHIHQKNAAELINELTMLNQKKSLLESHMKQNYMHLLYHYVQINFLKINLVVIWKKLTI